jgi:hypothetical protein
LRVQRLVMPAHRLAYTGCGTYSIFLLHVAFSLLT